MAARITQCTVETMSSAVAHHNELFECCQRVLERLGWPRRNGVVPPRTLGITSTARGEGVSTLAAHLAATAAAKEAGRVVLVDGNLASPTLHKTFQLELAPGLVECLEAGELCAGVFRQTSFAGLSVLCAGELQHSAAKLCTTAMWPMLLDELAAEFELVIFDLPLVGQQSCTSRLASLFDGIVLVVETEKVSWTAAQRAKELLAQAHANLLGVLLNKRQQYLPSWLQNVSGDGTG